MKHKRQHFVPVSYLRAWCDSNTPEGQTPYVWLHSDDGKEKRRKDPSNILQEPDYYTVVDTDGNRDLSIEKYLADIETHFPRIRQYIIEQKRPKSIEDLKLLCTYAALMLNRTTKQRDNVLGSYREMHELTVQLEKQHNAPPTTSLETKVLAEQGHHIDMIESLEQIFDFLGRMSKALLFNRSREPFITSDAPCLLHNPKAVHFPPLLRSPGFAQKDVEFIFPISPEVIFMATWSNLNGTHEIDEPLVRHINRVVRFKCHKYFVTCNGVVNDFWFDPGAEPDDSWENQERRRQSKH